MKIIAVFAFILTLAACGAKESNDIALIRQQTEINRAKLQSLQTDRDVNRLIKN